MDKVVFNMSNAVYEPLIERAKTIRKYLESAGFIVTKIEFYNNHFIKDNNEFVVEHYPIPIFSIIDTCDVGIDISSTWLEVKLPREKAILLDYQRLIQSFKFEVYGAENYCSDFYNSQLDPYETADRIKRSQESEICVAFDFDIDVNTDEIVKAIHQCNT